MTSWLVYTRYHYIPRTIFTYIFVAEGRVCFNMQYVPFLTVCVALVNANVGASELRPLYVLAILPQYEDSINDVDQFEFNSKASTLMRAGQLAEFCINYDQNLLPGYTFKLIHADSGCAKDKQDGTTAVATLMKELFYSNESRNIVGIVGPICSEPSLALSYQIAMPGISLTAVTMADSLTLSNREVYQNTFSTVASSRLIVNALVALMTTNSWNDVAIIYDASEEYFKTIYKELQSEMQRDSSLRSYPTVLFDQFSLIRFDIPTFIRIVFLLASPEIVRRVLCLASLYNEVTIAYPNYQFVVVSDPSETFVDTTPVPFTYDRHTISCTVEEMRRVWNQTIILRYHLEPQDVTFISDTGFSYLDFFKHNRPNTLRCPYYAAVYFDAIWAIAFALNNSLSTLNLSEYSFGQVSNTKLFRQQLEMLDFIGVSGPINFNNSTGFTDRNVDIFQVKNTTLTLLEYYDSSTGRIEHYTNESVDYINGRFDQYLYASQATGILFTILFILVTAVLVCVQVLNVTHARYPSIKASNPKIAHFAFVGCYIMIVGVMVFIVGEAFDVSGGNKCHYRHAYNCLLFIGWTTLFATLCARSFRIHRIFVHYLDPGRFIGDLNLMSFVIGVVLGAVLFVVGWSIYAVKLRLPTPRMILNARNGEPVLWIECINNDNYNIWMLFANLYTWFFALVACILATLSIGKVKLRNFQISFVIVLCYSLLLLHIAIGILIIATGADQNIGSDSELIVREVNTNMLLAADGTLQFISLCICLSLLFIPPVSPLLKDKCQEHVKPKVTSCFESLQTKYSSYRADNHANGERKWAK